MEGTLPDPIHTQAGALARLLLGFGVIWGLGESKRTKEEKRRNWPFRGNEELKENKPGSEVKGWGKPLRAGERWIKGLAYRGSARSPMGAVPPSPGMRQVTSPPAPGRDQNPVGRLPASSRDPHPVVWAPELARAGGGSGHTEDVSGPAPIDVVRAGQSPVAALLAQGPARATPALWPGAQGNTSQMLHTGGVSSARLLEPSRPLPCRLLPASLLPPIQGTPPRRVSCGLTPQAGEILVTWLLAPALEHPRGQR